MYLNKKLFFYILTGLLLIIFFNYNQKRDLTGESHKMNRMEHKNDIQVGFGLKGTTGSYQDVFYEIKSNKFIGNFIIDNKSRESYEYGVLLLMDYIQTNIELKEMKKKQTNFILIKLKPFEKKEIEFETFIPDGQHSLTAILIWEPNRRNTKDGLITDIVNYKRVTIIANDVHTKIPIEFNIKSQHKIKSAILENDEIELVKSKDDIKNSEVDLWLVDLVSESKWTVPFNIVLSNIPTFEKDIRVKNYAIIGILNGKQIPVKIDGQNRLIHYGNINANEQVIIPAEIEFPYQKNGNFYLLLINRPFEEFEANTKSFDEYYLKFSVNYSKRVTINKLNK